MGFKVERELDLDFRVEKRGDFGDVGEGEKLLKEPLLADKTPPGAWLSTSIFFPLSPPPLLPLWFSLPPTDFSIGNIKRNS